MTSLSTPPHPGEAAGSVHPGARSPSSAPRPQAGAARVLVVDDEPATRRALARAALAAGLAVDTAESGAAALDLLRSRPVDVVLLDHEMPEMDGLATLSQMRRRHPDVEVVLLVPLGDPAVSGPALRAGAYAIVPTPLVSPDAAVPFAERAIERRRLASRVRALEAQLAEHEQLGEMVGSSPRMQELARRAAAAASSSANVLVLGEAGSGKGLVARSIHRRGGRAHGPLVVWSPSALHEDAAAAALAEALEAAEAGTLILDDLGDLPRAAQAELATWLATRKPSAARVLATAEPDLRDRVARGAFREDLFYRLASVLLEVPPLRRRREDIPLLAYHFLARYAAREEKTIRRIGPEALRALRDHAWPGNVGELRSAIEHAVVMARGDAILPTDLPLDRSEDVEDGDPRAPRIVASSLLDLPYAEAKERALLDFDGAYVEQAMKRTGGNVSEAARLAGMDRSNFRRVLKKVREPKKPG